MMTHAHQQCIKIGPSSFLNLSCGSESIMQGLVLFLLVSQSIWMCYCEGEQLKSQPSNINSNYYSADDGKSLLVKVVAEYDPPSSFTSEPPSYRAASALTLSCQVEGVDDHTGLFYEWSSTCSGNCFTRGGVTKKVSTPYIHSYDTGVHTCMVYDVKGCTGNASISVDVVGELIIYNR